MVAASPAAKHSCGLATISIGNPQTPYRPASIDQSYQFVGSAILNGTDELVDS